MIIFPAVDLQGGQAVRLRQGKAEESTVFSPDPVAAALRWQNEGAQWLHLVDLDGAFQGESVNASQVRAICSTLEIPVQLGGGVRDEAAARMWFDAGVSRLIIGTLALENPEEFSRICKLFPGRIGVSLDADNGRLKTRGWVKDSGLMVDEIVPGLADAGAAFLIYTDIARDGMKSGVNLPMLEKLSRESPVPVIAAGGVNSLADIEALYPLSVEAGLEGAISGRALYDGSLKLPEALDFLRKNRLQADSAGSGSLSFLTGRKRNGIPSGSCMDMCMSTDAFPLEHLVEESEEPLWFWDILSDRLCLSLGVLNKLELSPQEAPADMKAYLRHLPPAEQDAVRHTLEEFLSSGEQLFRLLYFFDCRQVVAYAGVFRRDAGGRPIQIIGCLELAEQTPHIPFVGHAVAFLDKDLVCFDRNCAILLNREQAEPFTRSLGETVDLLHESERWQLRSLRRMYVPGSACDQFEENFMLLQNGGTYTRLNVNISVVQRDDRGRATMLAATLQSAFSSQSAAGSLLTLAVRGTGDGLWDWDATNDSVYYSPRYLSMLGYTTESFPPCLESWMKNIHPDDYEQTVPIQKAVVESPSSGNSFEVTYRMKKADNSWAWILGRGHVTHRDENGRATRLIGLHTDISAVQYDRERLEDMIKRDTLTGLYSRAFFEMMVKEHNCKPSWPISVISCDLNGLKLVNDYLGHAAGDEVLTQGASLLRRCMRVSDCVARVGGDEFVALLPHCSAIQAQRIMADIQRNISICNTDTSRIPVYLSLGSSTSEGDRTLQETIHEADRIMLEQKVKTRVNSHHSIKRWIESHHHIEVSLTDSRNVGI